MQEFCRAWADDYDWRDQEAWLNGLEPQFALVDGVDLHVWQVSSGAASALPLLLLHGWPGSVIEFRHLIDPLTSGSPSFDLVIPSLPGFGFGGKPAEPGWGVTRSAEAFHTLMTEVLGHERYGIQGGDWGAIIGSRLAQLHPESVVGLHTNYPLSGGDIDPAWSAGATPFEQESLAHLAAYTVTERGYSAIQSTKPQTLAFAQADSPAGLAAWILEKFQTWSDGGLAAFERRRSAHQPHVLLGPELGGLLGRDVFRVASRRRGACAPDSRCAGRRCELPARDHARLASLGRDEVSRRAIHRDAEGRPLRRAGTAGAARG